jgi:predicted peptidase
MPSSKTYGVLSGITLAALTLNLKAQPTNAPLPQERMPFQTRLTRTVSLNYLLYLPRNYQASGAKHWPMILFLHGAGERGADLALVAKHGPPKLVAQKQEFPFVIVSPQCAASQRWDDEALLALLDHVLSKYKVDATRIYLTGLSMGGYGAWSLAVNHPERFAAAAPICGGGNGIDVLLAEGSRKRALQSLPIWAFHGAKDPIVPVQESQRMMAAIKRAGCTNVQLTIYPEAEHDAFTQTYNNPKLYEWFLEHQRE